MKVESAPYLALLHLSTEVVNKMFHKWYGVDTNQSEQMPVHGAEAGSEGQGPLEERLRSPGSPSHRCSWLGQHLWTSMKVF